jgi:hypothetical protein
MYECILSSPPPPFNYSIRAVVSAILNAIGLEMDIDRIDINPISEFRGCNIRRI